MKDAPFVTQNLLKQVSSTFAWDFAFDPGDSVKEKYGNFYKNVRTLCLHQNGRSPATVVGHPFVTSIFETLDLTEEILPKYEKLKDGIVHRMEFVRDCGNGYKTNFQLYSDETMKKDELLVVNENKVSIVKIFNFVV